MALGGQALGSPIHGPPGFPPIQWQQVGGVGVGAEGQGSTRRRNPVTCVRQQPTSFWAGSGTECAVRHNVHLFLTQPIRAGGPSWWLTPLNPEAQAPAVSGSPLPRTLQASVSPSPAPQGTPIPPSPHSPPRSGLLRTTETTTSTGRSEAQPPPQKGERIVGIGAASAHGHRKTPSQVRPGSSVGRGGGTEGGTGAEEAWRRASTCGQTRDSVVAGSRKP